jgi:hypothetical protein
MITGLPRTPRITAVSITTQLAPKTIGPLSAVSTTPKPIEQFGPMVTSPQTVAFGATRVVGWMAGVAPACSIIIAFSPGPLCGSESRSRPSRRQSGGLAVGILLRAFAPRGRPGQCGGARLHRGERDAFPGRCQADRSYSDAASGRCKPRAFQGFWPNVFLTLCKSEPNRNDAVADAPRRRPFSLNCVLSRVATLLWFKRKTIRWLPNRVNAEYWQYAKLLNWLLQ